jgi:hypothetical protein
VKVSLTHKKLHQRNALQRSTAATQLSQNRRGTVAKHP